MVFGCAPQLLLSWLCFIAFSTLLASGLDSSSFPLLMPHVVPRHKDSYLCTAVRMDPTQEYYITAYEPNATKGVTHHMILFGCGSPASTEEVWTCGEMHDDQSKGQCSDGQPTMLYAWAKEAPELILPADVAFAVGGQTETRYLVLQVHYASVDRFKGGFTDDSGISIRYTETPQPKSAGIVLLGTAGSIKPHSIEYMETACSIKENIVIHPFAFRTHTHSLGRVVSGYKIEEKNGELIWTVIGKKDPQLPQMFYPVETDMTISKGDMIAARCTMESDRDSVTKIGSTIDDEMCNFYVMYWTYSRTPMQLRNCFTPGPPTYYWDMEFMAVPRDASLLPVQQE